MGPGTLDGSFTNPLLECRLDLSQVNENVLACLDHWGSEAGGALRVDQVYGVDELAASVTLVTLSVGVGASIVGAATSDHSIGQGRVALQAEMLVDAGLVGATFGVQSHEDILGDFGLLGCGGTTEFVEVTVEPFIDLGVELMVVVTDLLRRLAFLTGLCLSSRAILISAADIDSVVSSEAAEPGVNISREDAPNNVAKMGHVVNVGQRARDQDVALAFLGQDDAGVDASELRI